MTKEEKDLLLKDLCARLPYLVKGLYQWKGNVPFDRELDGMLYDELYLSLYRTGDSSFKPYLRTMSSMTEGEKREYTSYCFEQPFLQENKIPNLGSVPMCIDWLNAHHFDYRGLIKKGLALEAPEGKYEI